MVESFKILQFFPDGAAPETGLQEVSQLSERWVNVSLDLLNNWGPVFDQSLGSTLAHFRITLNGPAGSLLAHNNIHYEFAILPGTNSSQEQQSARWFAERASELSSALGCSLATESQQVIASSVYEPTLLLLDHSRDDIAAEQRQALFQLGLHLVGAYYRWSAHASR